MKLYFTKKRNCCSIGKVWKMYLYSADKRCTTKCAYPGLLSGLSKWDLGYMYVAEGKRLDSNVGRLVGIIIHLL